MVGKDIRMHELLIFVSTLGGIFMFGFPGLFIGPVIASLFVSIWEMYGVEFADVLPDVDTIFAGERLTATGTDTPLADASDGAGTPASREVSSPESEAGTGKTDESQSRSN